MPSRSRSRGCPARSRRRLRSRRRARTARRCGRSTAAHMALPWLRPPASPFCAGAFCSRLFKAAAVGTSPHPRERAGVPDVWGWEASRTVAAERSHATTAVSTAQHNPKYAERMQPPPDAHPKPDAGRLRAAAITRKVKPTGDVACRRPANNASHHLRTRSAAPLTSSRVCVTPRDRAPTRMAASSVTCRRQPKVSVAIAGAIEPARFSFLDARSPSASRSTAGDPASGVPVAAAAQSSRSASVRLAPAGVRPRSSAATFRAAAAAGVSEYARPPRTPCTSTRAAARGGSRRATRNR